MPARNRYGSSEKGGMERERRVKVSESLTRLAFSSPLTDHFRRMNDRTLFTYTPAGNVHKPLKSTAQDAYGPHGQLHTNTDFSLWLLKLRLVYFVRIFTQPPHFLAQSFTEAGV